MTTAANDLLDLYLFPLSRQQYVLRRIDAVLDGCGDEPLRRRVAEAIGLGELARELEFSFRGRPGKSEFGPKAQQLDHELDRAVGAVSTHLTATVRAFGDASAEARLAGYVRTRLFPNGVRAVVHLPYVEQEETVRLILRRVETEPRLGWAVRELGADRFLDRVAAVHVRYGEALSESRERATYAQVQAARREGQERLCRIAACLLVGALNAEPESDAATALWEALDVVKEQNAAIGRYYSRRRRVSDVDPTTGEVFEPVEGDSEAVGDVEPRRADTAEAGLEPRSEEDVGGVADANAVPNTREIRVETHGERVADPRSASAARLRWPGHEARAG